MQRSFGHEDDFAAHGRATWNIGDAGSFSAQVSAWCEQNTPPIRKFVESFTHGVGGEASPMTPPRNDGVGAASVDSGGDLEGFTDASGSLAIGPRLGMLDDRLLESGSLPGSLRGVGVR